MANYSRWARLAALAAVPPVGGLFGGAIDEWSRLGFTTWRSACRAAGLSPGSVLAFTLQLLPNAVIGVLLGGLLVQVAAFSTRHREGNARLCLAAHAGCAISMPVGLMLCALALPVSLMLLAEIALAVFVAFHLLALQARNCATPAALHP